MMMENAVMVDSERKEELVLAKNLRACSTPFRAQVSLKLGKPLFTNIEVFYTGQKGQIG